MLHLWSRTALDRLVGMDGPVYIQRRSRLKVDSRAYIRFTRILTSRYTVYAYIYVFVGIDGPVYIQRRSRLKVDLRAYIYIVHACIYMYRYGLGVRLGVYIRFTRILRLWSRKALDRPVGMDGPVYIQRRSRPKVD